VCVCMCHCVCAFVCACVVHATLDILSLFTGAISKGSCESKHQSALTKAPHNTAQKEVMCAEAPRTAAAFRE